MRPTNTISAFAAGPLLVLGACGGGAGAPDETGGAPLPVAAVSATAGREPGASEAGTAPVSATPEPTAAGTVPAPEPSGDGADTAPAPPRFEPVMRAVLTDLPVSSSQYVAFQTPIDVADGAVYIGNAEPGADGDGEGAYLRTVVRRGVRVEDGGWNWTSTLVEDRTAYDTWHTPPSVGVDGRGRVHVAYNMHNFPWQYGVFDVPNSLDGFRFLGDPISDEEIALHVEQNRTGFEEPGSAAVPGTQVTYPIFARDATGMLHLSSRQAGRPARDFPERTMSAGIARLDPDSDAWSAVGAELPLLPGDVETPDGSLPSPVVFAARTGWTAYPPFLEFDAANRMHAFFFWREGTAGRTLQRPCFVVVHGPGDVRFADGSRATLPLAPEACIGRGPGDGGRYYTVTDTAMGPDGRFHVVLSPESGGRRIFALEDGRWRGFDSPDDAGEIFFDAEGGLWAIADGPVAWRRPAGTDAFEPVLDAPRDDNCHPHAVTTRDGRRAYVHARGCREDRVSVYEIDLLSSR